MKHEYSLFKRKDKKAWYVYYYDKNGKRVSKSTGQTVKYKAEEYARQLVGVLNDTTRKDVTFGDYAQPFFLWDSCPHIRRLLDERKSITRRHARNQRIWLEKYILPDKIAEKSLGKITRADLIDFRSRVLRLIPEKINSVNKVMTVLKTIIKEALIREEIEKDPTVGLGMIKYEPVQRGIFSLEELENLFPADSLGPWNEVLDYTCFLVAASTGMRRGEILALSWKDIDFDNGAIRINSAWKDREELGLPKWNKVRVTPMLLFRKQTLSKLKELKLQSGRSGPDDLVFCYGDGTRLGSTWWQGRFRSALRKAEIDCISRNLHPHSFRHSLNTILRDKGKDPAKVRAVLGWRQEKTQDGYTHFDIEHFRDLVIGE
jgi:integrase